MRIKNILFALLLSVASSPFVMAGEFEDALAAYNRQDYKTALRLLKNAAQKDENTALSQYFLGEMYSKGTGVQQEFTRILTIMISHNTILRE